MLQVTDALNTEFNAVVDHIHTASFDTFSTEILLAVATYLNHIEIAYHALNLPTPQWAIDRHIEANVILSTR